MRKNLKNIDYDEENLDNGKKTVCYYTYDITEHLKEGKNFLNVMLGTGFYCNTDKLITDPNFSFGTPKLFFEIHLDYGDKKEIIISDEQTLYRNTIYKSHLYGGDYADFSLTSENYRKSTFAIPPQGRLVFPRCESDAVFKEISPVKRIESENGLILDFGENHSGALRMTVKGKRGTGLKIRYFEVLKGNKPDLGSCRFNAYDLKTKEYVFTIYQDSEYVLSGEKDEITPLFHWNCYRYAEIIAESEIEIFYVKSYFICSDIVKDGDFTCSEPLYNKLYDAFIRTLRANMHAGMISDCPHREKLPYTGDGQVIAESVIYSLGAENFYNKWLEDLINSQGKNGFLPYSAPFLGGGGGYWWSNALAVVSLLVYDYYGDKEALEKSYGAMKDYIAYLNTAHDGDYIIKRSDASWLLGEWITPETNLVDVKLMNTLAYYFAVSAVLRTALILGDEKEQIKSYEMLSENIKRAINEKFYDRENTVYGKGVQGESVIPCALGIAGKNRKKVLKKIISYYQKTLHLDTGMIITPFLLQLLTENGYADLCHALMTEKAENTYYSMLQGETTLCETKGKRWNGVKEDEIQSEQVSHCHPVLGEVTAWLHKHVAGLDLSLSYKKKIVFAPKLVFEVKKASAYKKMPSGVASTEYDNSGRLKGFIMKVVVPDGYEAEILLPKSLGKLFTDCGKKFKRCRKGYVLNVSGGTYNIYSKKQDKK